MITTSQNKNTLVSLFKVQVELSCLCFYFIHWEPPQSFSCIRYNDDTVMQDLHGKYSANDSTEQPASLHKTQSLYRNLIVKY